MYNKWFYKKSQAKPPCTLDLIHLYYTIAKHIGPAHPMDLLEGPQRHTNVYVSFSFLSVAFFK